MCAKIQLAEDHHYLGCKVVVVVDVVVDVGRMWWWWC
jgi:hypothetical protein